MTQWPQYEMVSNPRGRIMAMDSAGYVDERNDVSIGCPNLRISRCALRDATRHVGPTTGAFHPRCRDWAGRGRCQRPKAARHLSDICLSPSCRPLPERSGHGAAIYARSRTPQSFRYS
jgi:hypothetical protein